MRSKLASRKLWVAIITALVLLVNQLVGLHLDPNAVLPAALIIVAYILGQALVDTNRAAPQ